MELAPKHRQWVVVPGVQGVGMDNDPTRTATVTTTDNAPRTQGPRATLIDGWTNLWNGDLAEATRVGSDSIGVHFGGRTIGELGDRVSTPAGIAALIGEFRSTRLGLRYRVVEANTTDTWGYCLWDASLGDLRVGGIDTFAFDDTGISQVHSVTAERPMSH